MFAADTLPYLPCLRRLLPAILLVAVPLRAQLAHRQTDLTLKVQNLQGVALVGATVKVDMINPAFRFGDAIEMNDITPGMTGYSDTTVKYLQEYFNSATLGNELKWAAYESRPVATTIGYIRSVMALKPFNSSGSFRFRGHATIWGAQYNVPLDVRAMTDAPTLRTRILNHVYDYHTALKGLGVDCWDLYNEPFHERTYFIDKLAPANPTAAQEAVEIAPWYKKAKEADPTAQLFINEYNMLNFWQENDADIIKYKALIDAIRDAGGEIGGIGLQGHMDRVITKTQILRRLAILAAPMAATAAHPNGLPGLPIEITELDTAIALTPQQQADTVAAVMDGAFETPAVQGITMWGLNDSRHWRKNAVLFDDSDPANWKVKPSGQEWINRVKGSWWTKIASATDTTGALKTSVFKGKHRIVVEYLGQSQEFIRDLTSPTDLVVQFSTDPADTAHSRLANMSVRTKLAAKQEVTIGFVASGGTGAVPVLVRAAGPALSEWLTGVMPDPRMTVYTKGQVAGTNDNWDVGLKDAFTSVGAFPFGLGSKDAATTVTSSGADNTVIVSGDTGGYVLVEAYDRSPSEAAAKLANFSARNQVGTGDEILIAGFNISGSGYKRVLIRGIGPALLKWGVTDALVDPKLELYRIENGISTLIQTNDNWSGLADTFTSVAAFQLDPGSKDAALVALLPTGSYTAQVSGVNGTTGNGMVEVYELP